MKPRFNYKFIRENIKDFETSIQLRKLDGNPKKVSDLYDHWRNLTTQIDEIRHKRKVISRQQNVEEGKVVKQKLKELESEQSKIEQELLCEVRLLPNLLHSSVPHSQERLIRTVGSKPTFDFSMKPFPQIAKDLDLVDFESAALTSGGNKIFFCVLVSIY